MPKDVPLDIGAKQPSLGVAGQGLSGRAEWVRRQGEEQAMANTMEFFKKWTTILPGPGMNSDAFEVTPFKTTVVKAYVAGFIAPGPLALQVEDSPDMVTWNPIGAVINIAGPGLWGNGTFSDTQQYLRVVATSPGGQMTFFAFGVGREN